MRHNVDLIKPNEVSETLYNLELRTNATLKLKETCSSLDTNQTKILTNIFEKYLTK